MPNLVKLVGPPSTLAEELSPFITRSAAKTPSVRLQVFLSGSTSASVASVAAELLAPGLLNTDL